MSIIDKWLERAVSGLGFVKADTIPRNTELGYILSGESSPGSGLLNVNNWSQDQLERLAACCTWVASDINVIANTLASTPFGVYQRTGERDEAIEAHPFEVLLEFPCPFWDQELLLTYTAWWYSLRGEAYWMLVPDKGGGLAQIWPLPASRMRPIPDAQNYIRGFGYTSTRDGQERFLPPESVAFFRRANPFDYHRGMSPISAYKLEMASDRSAAEWNKEAYDKGLTLDAILSVPPEMSPRQFEAVKEEIRHDIETEHKRWIIARAGDLKATTLGMTAKDAEYLGSRVFNSTVIDRVYGFPEGFWSVQANRANAEAAKATVIENTVWPMCTRFARTITDRIIRPFYGDDLRGRFDDIRPRDRSLLVQERRVYWQVMSIDEARAELELDPLDDPMLGATLVPLAVQQQGGGVGSIGGIVAEGQQPQEEPGVSKAAQDDLRKWQRIALRRLKDSGDPAYAFDSEHIPPDVSLGVLDALKSATTEEEVRAAFAAGFCHDHDHGGETVFHDWANYP